MKLNKQSAEDDSREDGDGDAWYGSASAISLSFQRKLIFAPLSARLNKPLLIHRR